MKKLILAVTLAALIASPAIASETPQQEQNIVLEQQQIEQLAKTIINMKYLLKDLGELIEAEIEKAEQEKLLERNK